MARSNPAATACALKRTNVIAPSRPLAGAEAGHEKWREAIPWLQRAHFVGSGLPRHPPLLPSLRILAMTMYFIFSHFIVSDPNGKMEFVCFALRNKYFQVMKKGGCVYIMTNARNTTLYVGVAEDLFSRAVEHREKKYPKSFTSRYNLTKLVYYESFYSIEEAIAREKQIKAGSRTSKEKLINSMNPTWKDLFEEISKW